MLALSAPRNVQRDGGQRRLVDGRAEKNKKNKTKNISVFRISPIWVWTLHRSVFFFFFCCDQSESRSTFLPVRPCCCSGRCTVLGWTRPFVSWSAASAEVKLQATGPSCVRLCVCLYWLQYCPQPPVILTCLLSSASHLGHMTCPPHPTSTRRSDADNQCFDRNLQPSVKHALAWCLLCWCFNYFHNIQQPQQVNQSRNAL